MLCLEDTKRRFFLADTEEGFFFVRKEREIIVISVTGMGISICSPLLPVTISS